MVSGGVAGDASAEETDVPATVREAKVATPRAAARAVRPIRRARVDLGALGLLGWLAVGDLVLFLSLGAGFRGCVGWAVQAVVLTTNGAVMTWSSGSWNWAQIR